jgi:hypothetical protein
VLLGVLDRADHHVPAVNRALGSRAELHLEQGGVRLPGLVYLGHVAQAHAIEPAVGGRDMEKGVLAEVEVNERVVEQSVRNKLGWA